MAKECTLSTCKLPPEGLPRNSVVRITDSLDMTSAVYHGSKETNQTNKTLLKDNFIYKKVKENSHLGAKTWPCYNALVICNHGPPTPGE